MPATLDAGDLIVAFVWSPLNITNPSGWTALHNSTFRMRGGCFAKISDGTEDGGTVDFVTESGKVLGAHVFRVTGWLNTTIAAGAQISTANGDSGTPDPASLTPTGGNKQYLWFAVACHNNPAAATDGPDGFSAVISSTISGGGNGSLSLHTCRLAEAASSKDPTSFTVPTGGANAWNVNTVAIYPPLSGGGGGFGGQGGGGGKPPKGGGGGGGGPGSGGPPGQLKRGIIGQRRGRRRGLVQI